MPCPRAWPSTWWWTCSPRRAVAMPRRTSSPPLSPSSSRSTKQSSHGSRARVGRPPGPGGGPAGLAASRARARGRVQLDHARPRCALPPRFRRLPLLYGIYLSLQDRPVAKPGLFVGLANFVTLAHDPVFWQVTSNTFLYVAVTTVLKLLGGLGMALVMNQTFRARNIVRALLLLPFIVPTILSTIAWMWIFDPTFSVINWTLVKVGLVAKGFSWLGNATLAMVAIIIVNTWRGIPFYGISILAGLQTISPDLYEAAAIDGASINQRFWHVTMPIIKPILIIVTMFSVIFTFADFQIVYALTHGGPANATQVFVTYAYDLGMSAGQLGMGAAAALTMLPALILLIIGLTLYLRRE